MRDRVNIVVTSEENGLQIKCINGYWYIALTSSIRPTRYYLRCYISSKDAKKVLAHLPTYMGIEDFLEFEEIEKVEKL